MRIRGLVVSGLALVLGVAAAVAVAAPGAASGGARAKPARLAVGVEVLHFAGAGSQVTARGVVTARLTDQSGHVTTVSDPVALTAKTGGGCRVLHLDLKQLELHLLGLNARLDRVTLDITGNARGGALGSLFCRLARARVASVRASAARALNAQVRRHRGQALRFTAYLRPQATASQANPTCPVLDLVVGPLDLQLLGLVVDLNRVHLSVTATRGQGVLGDTFCKLADNTQTTTT